MGGVVVDVTAAFVDLSLGLAEGLSHLLCANFRVLLSVLLEYLLELTAHLKSVLSSFCPAVPHELEAVVGFGYDCLQLLRRDSFEGLHEFVV